jgi:hypothetical protein
VADRSISIQTYGLPSDVAFQALVRVFLAAALPRAPARNTRTGEPRCSPLAIDAAAASARPWHAGNHPMHLSDYAAKPTDLRADLATAELAEALAMLHFNGNDCRLICIDREVRDFLLNAMTRASKITNVSLNRTGRVNIMFETWVLIIGMNLMLPGYQSATDCQMAATRGGSESDAR